MTDQQHPIVFSDKQLQHWIDKITYPHNEGVGPSVKDRELATLAYRAGADAELEGCCKTIKLIWEMDHIATDHDVVRELRAARRPKPPSLKEQALKTLQKLSVSGYPCNYQGDEDWDTIRRALEALPND